MHIKMMKNRWYELHMCRTNDSDDENVITHRSFLLVKANTLRLRHLVTQQTLIIFQHLSACPPAAFSMPSVALRKLSVSFSRAQEEVFPGIDLGVGGTTQTPCCMAQSTLFISARISAERCREFA